ncbi:MAG: response regulator transcription factor [Methyloversatilis sp.]|uniref:response regulator transcription factor n=1 Tax=Methyloversatilis sp. TaxID=2569862 RepID=UPI001A54E484|nr:LuxR C-terminal-related transcriptional regulator [Methyloversatilis sp.]MBL8477651.1 response regulator transcription factor [Methyloversatilis sp.]
MVRELVCVVDDDERARRALAEALEGPDIEVQVFAGAGSLLQNRSAIARAACLVVSATLRDIGGVELQSSLRAIGSRALIVFVSGPCEVSQAVQAVRGGALDFLLKPVDPVQLRERVNEAIGIHSAQRGRRSRLVAVGQHLGTLTPREREVLERVMDGRQNAEIAVDLGISTKTVEQHRARVMTKMKVDSLAELVVQVTEWRLLSEPLR